MNTYKRVLTIAGSDSGGGAGIQADIKTMSACGCYGCSAITALTSQNTLGVQGIYMVPVEVVESQICSVLDDIGADAVKIGMLGSADIARMVAKVLKRYDVKNIVLDPVLVATSGDILSREEVVEVILNELMPLATVITPNIIEAQVLSGQQEPELIWQTLYSKGAKALLLKGGHAEVDNSCGTGTITDLLFTEQETRRFVNEWIETPNTHGTGCTLSSAVASFLAHDLSLEDAVGQATAYVHHAIATAREYSIGKGHGPVHHFYRFW